MLEMNPRPFPSTSLAPDPLFRRGTLEFSPKPLVRKDDGFLDGFFAELFRSYRQLLKHCDAVSLLFWLGDGTDSTMYVSMLLMISALKRGKRKSKSFSPKEEGIR